MKLDSTFKAGATRDHLSQWAKLTSDKFILSAVAGSTIEFDHLPTQCRLPLPLTFSGAEAGIVDEQIRNFLDLGIVEKTVHSCPEFVSNVFIRAKKDGSHRLILNLVHLNPCVEYHHFKMDTIENVIKLMRPDCYMASLDLTKAYFSVPIAQDFRCFLKFAWGDSLYQFKVLPFGLSSGPRTFTKILKPIYAHLRQQGHIVSGYLDDSFLMSQTFDQCNDNVRMTDELFTSLGFSINYTKSATTPSQQLEHLGFVLDSANMTVSLTQNKREKLKNKCRHILKAERNTIRDVAELIGILVASFTGVEYGRLHYRALDKDKVQALKTARGNFDASIVLSSTAKEEITWWIDNIEGETRFISHGACAAFLSTDASGEGWGAIYSESADSTVVESTGGRWSIEEKQDHINVLELKAGLLGIKAFKLKLSNIHVKLTMDSTTAISYVSRMGGSHSQKCNVLAVEFWELCRKLNLWVTAAHLPGYLNVLADDKSRIFDDKTEWKLNTEVFRKIVQQFTVPNIDLFASRLNCQLKQFVSWLPDPDAAFIDAFSLDWSKFTFYAFPPFSLVSRVLQKVEDDRASGILVLPNWSTQSWFPLLRRTLVAEPMMLGWSQDLVTLPFQSGPHPLGRKLKLMACHLCGSR